MEAYGITGFTRDGGRVRIPTEFAKELKQAARNYGCRVFDGDLSGSELFVPEPRRPAKHATIRGGYDWSRCRTARDNYRWIFKWLVSEGIARRHLDVDGLSESVVFLAAHYVGGEFEKTALALLLLDMNDYFTLADCIVQCYPLEQMLNDPDAAYLVAAAKDVQAMCRKYFQGFGPEYKAPGIGLQIAGDHAMMIPDPKSGYNYTRPVTLGGSWLYGPEPLEGESARASDIRRRFGRLRTLTATLCGSYLLDMNDMIVEPDRRRRRLQTIAINGVIPTDLSGEDIREVNRLIGDMHYEDGQSVEKRLIISREKEVPTPKSSERMIGAVMSSISDFESIGALPEPEVKEAHSKSILGAVEKEIFDECFSVSDIVAMFDKAGLFDLCEEDEITHPESAVVVCGVVPELMDATSVGFSVKPHNFAQCTPPDASCVVVSPASVVVTKPPSPASSTWAAPQGCHAVIKGKVASLVVWATSLGRNRSDPLKGGHEDFIDVVSDPVSGSTAAVIMYGDPARLRCSHTEFARAGMYKHLVDNLGLGTAEAGVLSRAFDLYRVCNLGAYTIAPRTIWRTEEYPVDINVYFGPYPVFGGGNYAVMNIIELYIAQCLTVNFTEGGAKAYVVPRSTLKLHQLHADLGLQLGFVPVNGGGAGRK